MNKVMIILIAFSLLPIYTLCEILLFTLIADLIRQPSDTSVLVGAITLTAFIYGNLLLFKSIYKLFKQHFK